MQTHLPRHIYLLGMPASGKTTLGKPLARVLGLPFVDLDAEVETCAGKGAQQIFAEGGEYRFREYEHTALIQVASRTKPHVVATGGGAPCFFGNMDLMNQSGRTIYLKVSTPELVRRLEANPQVRPLLAGNTANALALTVAQLLLEREPYYSRALGLVQRDAATLEDVLACL